MAKVVCKNKENIFYILYGSPYSSVYRRSAFNSLKDTAKTNGGKFIDTRMLDLDYYDGWLDNEHHITTKSNYYIIAPFYSLCLKNFKFDLDDFCEVPYYTADFKRDVSYLKPKKDYRFTMSINSKDVGSGLTFDQIQNVEHVYPEAAFYSEYHRLFRGAHSCCKVINETIDNECSIFISGDSMIIPLVPIFCCYYKEVVYMDNRDKKSHKEYYEGKTFDEILLCFFDGSTYKKVLEENLK